MITLRAKDTFLEMIDALKRIEQRQWPFVLSTATNNSAFRMVDKLKRDIPRYIDRPVPFTLNSFKVEKKATRSNPEALLGWRDWPGKDIGAGRPMINQAEGGERRLKAFERSLLAFGILPRGSFAIPSDDLPKDQFGNIQGRYYTQVLSYLRADRSGTQARPTGALNKKQKTRQSKRASKFFVVVNGRVFGSSQQVRLGDGIYERKNLAAGSAIRQAFFFSKQATYKVTFPAEKIANDYLNTIITDEINKAIDQAIKTTR